MDILNAERKAEDAYTDFYSMKWLGDNDGFYFIRQSRDLKRLDLCRVDIGADSTKTVVSERMNTYVEYRNPSFNKGRFVWWSERNGWANLYLYESDGTLVRALTDGAFHIEDILAVTDTYVLASACGVEKGENPYQMHTYKISLDGSSMVKLDMDDMDVLSTASDDGKYFIANYSRVDAKPAVALFDAVRGRKVM
jgi:hypothetical protein